jgi:hypothetical protein
VRINLTQPSREGDTGLGNLWTGVLRLTV